MATLLCQITNSHGVPSSAVIISRSYLVTSMGFYLNSLLINYCYLQIPVSNTFQVSLTLNSFFQYVQGYYINYLSSLARFFGNNVKQNSTQLIIQKSDLPLLTSVVNNSAESLLVAILLQAKEYEVNSLISRVVIEIFKQEIIVVDKISMLQSVFTINLYSLAEYIYNANPAINQQISNVQAPITPNNINN